MDFFEPFLKLGGFGIVSIFIGVVVGVIVFKIIDEININRRKCRNCSGYMSTKTDWKNVGTLALKVGAKLVAHEIGDSIGDSYGELPGKFAGHASGKIAGEMPNAGDTTYLECSTCGVIRKDNQIGFAGYTTFGVLLPIIVAFTSLYYLCVTYW